MFSHNFAEEMFTEIKCRNLTKYNTSVVNALVDEINYLTAHTEELNEKAISKNEITKEIESNFVLLQSYKERNERLHKIYHFDRLLKIEEKILSNENINKEMLSIDENEFVKEFKDALSDLFNPILDFNNQSLPISFYVHVVALKDCGVILTGEEFVDIKKNRIYFIKRNDINHLIEDGSMNEIK